MDVETDAAASAVIDWRRVGCGCQLDAAGNPFVDHCVCPPAAGVAEQPRKD